MRKLAISAALFLLCTTAHALPDWMPGKTAFEESRVADWNKKSNSNYKLNLERMAVDSSSGMKYLIFSGVVQNATGESIGGWVVDLRVLDKRTNSVVLSRRVHLVWSTPSSLNRKFDSVKFWMPYGDSQYFKIATSLGPNFGWNHKFISAIPTQYKDYDINKVFGVDQNEVWISHD